MFFSDIGHPILDEIKLRSFSSLVEGDGWSKTSGTNGPDSGSPAPPEWKRPRSTEICSLITYEAKSILEIDEIKNKEKIDLK